MSGQANLQNPAGERACADHPVPVAVVTGGANGIGKCIAEQFRKQGVRVYVIDIAEGDHYVGDISDKAVLEDFAQMVIRESGGVDYLINNALPLVNYPPLKPWRVLKWGLAEDTGLLYFL